MQSKIDPLPHQFEDNFNDIKSDSGSITVFSGGTVSPGSPAVLQRQWITLTAEMWPPSSSSSEESAGSSTQPFAPRISRLPLLAGVFCGAALVVAILGACLLYWCCIMPRKDNNNKLCSRKNDPNTISSSNTTSIQIQTTTVPGRLISSTNPSSSSSSSAYPISQSAVFAEQKRCGWGYTNRLIAGGGPLQPNPWYTSRVIGGPQCTQCPGICPVPRSNSSPSNSHHYCNNGDIPASLSSRRERPVSQPIIPSSNIVNINGETGISALPEISEFCPNSSQYASSSILDEIINDPNNTSRRNQNSSEEPTLKTRSLPAWVRSKPRPLSTEDDLNNLYAKVNFSKKRKNRMRNDEAAIIALSKSRSQFLHKDTDSLVDNEAVIVYDERTAL